LIGTWTDRSEDATHIAAVRAAATAFGPLSLGGSYVNFDAEVTTDGVRSAYGGAIYDRLAGLKRAYDPENLFSRNQNVKPLS
jgi:FAD/FMN-containing dehydrogenase